MTLKRNSNFNKKYTQMALFQGISKKKQVKHFKTLAKEDKKILDYTHDKW